MEDRKEERQDRKEEREFRKEDLRLQAEKLSLERKKMELDSANQLKMWVSLTSIVKDKCKVLIFECFFLMPKSAVSKASQSKEWRFNS